MPINEQIASEYNYTTFTRRRPYCRRLRWVAAAERARNVDAAELAYVPAV